MTGAADGRERWLEAFARFDAETAGRGPEWLRNLRRAAIERFASQGFPTPRDERWRHTSVAPFAKTAFQEAGRNGAAPERARSLDLSPAAPARLVFVNGRFASDSSSVRSLPPGAVVASLGEVLERSPAEIEGRLAPDPEEPWFASLNAAFFRDGAYVRLPDGAALEGPIELVFVSTPADDPTVSHPRNLIVAGRGSRATVVEHYVGGGAAPTFTNAVTDLVTGPGSRLDHVRLLEEEGGTIHFALLRARPGRDAALASHAILLGGGLVRNEIEALLDEEGIDLELNGLYLVDGRRHVDTQTRIVHAKPRSTSRELYKGILDGASRGIFEGTIVVRPDAQKTNAHQTNRNLLLSKEALATTRPVLEIFADDVRCKHGATIGQIEEDPLFYLRARGVGEEEARALLVYAFAEEVVEKLPLASLRERLGRLLLRRFSERPAPAEVR